MNPSFTSPSWRNCVLAGAQACKEASTIHKNTLTMIESSTSIRELAKKILLDAQSDERRCKGGDFPQVRSYVACWLAITCLLLADVAATLHRATEVCEIFLRPGNAPNAGRNCSLIPSLARCVACTSTAAHRLCARPACPANACAVNAYDLWCAGKTLSVGKMYAHAVKVMQSECEKRLPE